MPESQTNDPPKKRPTGKQATRFFLDKDQLSHADSYIPALEAEVLKHDPHFDGRSKAISDWSDATAQEIMNSRLFVNLPTTSGEPRPAWIKTIKRRFSNHVVNNMAPKFFKKFYLDHKDCASSTRGTQPLFPESRTQDVLRSAMAIFQGDTVTPRELFAEEAKERLADKIKEISAQFPNLVGGGLRNKALAILWESLEDSDKKVWEDAARSILYDIPTNRIHFPLLMANHLDRLCQRGCLGTLYTSFSFAVRNEDDSLVGKTIYSGYDCEKQEAITAVPVGSKSRATSWLDMANEILPRYTKTATPVFTLSPDGIPVFPIIDIAKASLEQLAGVLHDYICAVWTSSRSDAKGPVPWDNLASVPENFYDVELFSVPVALQNPTSYLNDPVNIYKLVCFFQNSTTPFRFHKSDKDTAPQHASATTHPSDLPLASSTIPDPDHNPTQVSEMEPSANSRGTESDYPNTSSESAETSPIPSSSPPTPKINKKRGRPRTTKNTSISVSGTATPAIVAAPAPVNATPAPVIVAAPAPVIVAAPAPVNATPAPVIVAAPAPVNLNATPTLDNAVPMPANPTPAQGNAEPAPASNAISPPVNAASVPIPSPPLVTTRSSTRKRKHSISEISKAQTANKKRRPGYFYTDGNGGFMDENGNPVDSNGNPISA